MKPSIYFFTIISAIIPGILTSNFLVNVHEKELLAEAALHVTKRYIAPKSDTLVVFENCFDCEGDQKDFQITILNNLLQNLNGLIKFKLYLHSFNDQPWNYNIFIINSLDAFYNLGFSFQSIEYDYEFYFLYILTQNFTDIEERNATLYSMFWTNKKDKVLNTVIMFEDLDGSIVFYTYKLIGVECWKDIVLTCSNKYENGALMRNYLFPKRLQNFKSCELRVCVYESPPFTIYQGDKNNETDLLDINNLSGLEGELLKILSKKLNFSVRLTFSEEFSIIGEENNSTGCFALLENDDVDIAIGGFNKVLKHHYIFSSTYPYHGSRLIFIIKRLWNDNQMEKLLNPFDEFVWYCIVATLLLGLIFIFFIKICSSHEIQKLIFGKDNQRPVLNMIVISLGYSLNAPPRYYSARILVMLWLIVTLLIRNFYQGKLFDVLRSSTIEPEQETIAQLIEDECLLFAPTYVDYYPKDLTVSADVSDFLLLDLVNVLSSRVLTIASEGSLAYFNTAYKDISVLSFFGEDIYNFFLVMYFQKHSMLKYSIDKKIKLLSNAGVLSCLEKRNIDRKKIFLNSKNLSAENINNEMLLGLYTIYIILNSLALAIFTLEIMTKSYKYIKRFLDCIQNF